MLDPYGRCYQLFKVMSTVHFAGGKVCARVAWYIGGVSLVDLPEEAGLTVPHNVYVGRTTWYQTPNRYAEVYDPPSPAQATASITKLGYVGDAPAIVRALGRLSHAKVPNAWWELFRQDGSVYMHGRDMKKGELLYEMLTREKESPQSRQLHLRMFASGISSDGTVIEEKTTAALELAPER